MDTDDSSAYPDPEISSYSNPYPAYSSISNGGPYGDPRAGGLWQTGNGLHGDGPYAQRSLSPEFDDESDSDDDLRGIYAQSGLDSILNAGTHHITHGNHRTEFSDHTPVEDQTDVDASLIDPNFEASGDESDAASSVDSEILDAVLNDEPLFGTSPEDQIEGRGEGKRRGRGRGRGRGKARGRGWKWALKGTEHDPNFNKEKPKRGRPSGSGRGRGRGRGGPSKPADPGEAFKRQQARATEKWLSGELDEAVDLARAAVRANPEIFAAYSLLSEVLIAQGKAKDALTVLIAGAHTKRDAELWHDIAGRTLEFAGEDRSEESLDTAAYCYSWAIRVNGQDYEARRQRLNLFLEIFSISGSAHTASRARQECQAMLKLRPSDINVTREYAELAILTRNDLEIAKAKTAYDEAFKIQTGALFKSAEADEEDQWNHALAYVDLVERVDGNEAAIQRFKRLARDIQGRYGEDYWDAFPNDDREFDSDDEPRKVQSQQYQEQKQSGKAHGEALILPMDMRVKLGLYRLALGEQHVEEALHHFRFLLQDDSDISGLADLFRDVADALKDKRKYSDAVTFFEPLQDVPDALDIAYYKDLAGCYVELKRVAEAEDCYQVVIDGNEQDWEARIALAKIYEEQGRRADALPLIRDAIRLGRSDALRKQDLGLPTQDIRDEERRRNRALRKEADNAESAVLKQLANDSSVNSIMDQVIMDVGSNEQLALREELGSLTSPQKRRTKATSRKTMPKTRKTFGVSNAGLQRQKKLTDTINNLKSANERVRSNYEIVLSCQADVAAGDEDAIAIWKSALQGMLDEYRNCKYLFSWRDKHLKFTGYGKQSKILQEMQEMRDRLEEADDNTYSTTPTGSGIPDDFCDIKFTTWLDLFCSYAIQLARDDQREQAFATLELASNSNVFYHSKPSLYQINMTMLACALLLNDEERLTTVSRWLMTTYPASATPFQIFASVHRIYSGHPNWFNAGPTQKYLLRAIKTFDYHMLPPAQRSQWPFTTVERNSMSGRSVQFSNLKDLQPSALVIYGHVMAAAQTWNSALSYYFRALAMLPDDPVLILCIGLAYVQNAMKRQSDNRHWGIMTGLGFLGKYRKIRREMAREKDNSLYLQEAEYNIARAWHLLGLNHLAARGYEKCLALGKVIGAERERRKKEAEARKMDVDGDEDIVMDPELGREDLDTEEYTQEAALGLVNIYMLTGQISRARALTEEFLVI